MNNDNLSRNRDELKRLAARLRGEGKSLDQISRDLDLSRETIRKWLAAIGVAATRGGKHAKASVDKALARQMLDAGVPLTTVAAHLKRDPKSLREILKTQKKEDTAMTDQRNTDQ